jgi:hypothetical protein
MALSPLTEKDLRNFNTVLQKATAAWAIPPSPKIYATRLRKAKTTDGRHTTRAAHLGN